jgi:hypothetical protein
MNITSKGLIATAGLCAAAAGAIFIGVQIDHPPADVAHLVTTEMAIRETAKVLMCILALIGFTGMFVRHHRRFGVLGLAGFSLLTVGFLALFATECIVGYVLPTVAHSNPAYVQDVLDAAVGGSPSGDIGGMHVLFLAAGIGYPLGGLMFGPGPLGLPAARLRHHLRPRARRAAGVLQPPVRGAHRRRADRPRRLAVARPAPAVRDRRRAGDGVGRGAGDPMSRPARRRLALSTGPQQAGALS